MPKHGVKSGYINMPSATVASHNRSRKGPASLQLLETVSGVKQASNSNLPRVRSVVAQYFGGARSSLSRILLNRYDKTVTAIGSQPDRLPQDITVTARVGCILVKDNGVRLEFKRRFQSGIEVGTCYTHTKGNDITMSGTPFKPYQDSSIIISLPLNSMLPMDTELTAGPAIWRRWHPWLSGRQSAVACPA